MEPSLNCAISKPAENRCKALAVPEVPHGGKVFVTADGWAMTFVSDADILDDRQPHEPNIIYPSGFLMFRDGTRYRIDTGKVKWIRDNNGNKVSFTYSGNNLIGIDDSLNRHVSLTPGGEITFKGANGALRTIKVISAPLSTALRKYPDGSTDTRSKRSLNFFLCKIRSRERLTYR